MRRAFELQPHARRIITMLRRSIRETGLIPSWYFDEFGKIFPQIMLSLAVLHIDNGGRIRILLTRRPLGDIDAGKLHVPSTTKRPNDPLPAMWQRLLREDLSALLVKEEPQFAFIDEVNAAERKRGDAIYLFHIVYAWSEKISTGEWFDIQNLPADEIVPYHLRFLQKLCKWIDVHSRDQQGSWEPGDLPRDTTRGGTHH